MSIEFTCSGCGNALRVPDDQAGRQAKCPVCEQLTVIPTPTVAAAEPVEGFEPEATQSAMPTGATAGSKREHRGVSILIFGILSLFCCGLLGIVAWVMANEDLALMDRGVMDPTGRGMTLAGKVLGIIGLFVSILAILPIALHA